MFVYTSCRTCGELLLLGSGLVKYVQFWHPNCEPKLTKLEELEHRFNLAEIAMENLTAKGLNDGVDQAVDAMLTLEGQIKEIQSRPPNLPGAARLYAQWGWPVFPLLADGEAHPVTGVISDGKKPATQHGFKDATTDVARIDAWWARHPSHNIGIAAGHTFDVVDVDVPKQRDGKWTADGRIALRELMSKIDGSTGKGPLPDCHGIVTSASGGMHLYMRPTGSGNRGGWKPGIDIRGQGGYVVVPPSILANGKQWEWTVPPSPWLKVPLR